jgi:hypothetical protein
MGNILLNDLTNVSSQSFNAGPTGGTEVAAKNLQLSGASGISVDNLTDLTPGNITLTLSDALSAEGKSAKQLCPVDRLLLPV